MENIKGNLRQFSGGTGNIARVAREQNQSFYFVIA